MLVITNKMTSTKKAESDVEIRILKRDELKVIADNCYKQGWTRVIEYWYMMYDALTTKGCKVFGAVDKNGKILSMDMTSIHAI